VSDHKVLVIGDDTRSFLAIVRSLGRRGIAIHAAPSNFRSPALRSRYIGAIHELPPWIGDGNEWLNATTELLRRQRYSLVIPCNETALLPLQRYRTSLSEFARLAIPDDRAIAVFFDKHKTRELAERLGVNIAAGRLIAPGDTAEKVLSELGEPVLVKPRRSYSLETLALRQKVEVLNDPIGLQKYLNQFYSNDVILEEYFSGQGIGVSVLASHGRLLQAFEHHRVREMDGASFYRRSAPITPELVDAARLLIAALDYTGLAMFEFKRNTIGQWALLEVNARPWGSMPLPLALGVDFPYRWYRLLTLGEETPAVDYPKGIYGRNLLPDLRMLLLEAAARPLSRVGRSLFVMGRLLELRRLLVGQEIHDVFARGDVRPAIVELVDAGHAIFRKIAKLFPGAASVRRTRARARLRALSLNPGPLVVFVCQGNICRSPFAEALLRAELPNTRVSVASAGIMAQSGRSSPPFAVDSGAKHGIDLRLHRSIWLTPEMARAASLLIVFDELTRAAVADRYPDTSARVVLLGDLIGIGQIADPVDGSAEDFRRTYNEINTAIVEIASLLRGLSHSEPSGTLIPLSLKRLFKTSTAKRRSGGRQITR
jgi:protein-tyrosine-phosphatase/predicted ATP-grasp superfamily ATP-dependent carboligase